jgi:HEAT repeat protein
MRYLCVLLLLGVMGCGGGDGTVGTPTKVAKKTSSKQKSTKTPMEVRNPPPPPVPKVADDLFSSIPAALDAVEAATKSDDPKAQKTISDATLWLGQQGAAGVKPLGEILNDESASFPRRLTACRALVKLPGGKEPLLAALGTKEVQLRKNVIRALGSIRPADKELVAKCLELAKTDDPVNQQFALIALGDMGGAAKEAVPVVQNMLNDKKYNETVRAQARDTLKSIDPRKGLMGINDQ